MINDTTLQVFAFLDDIGVDVEDYHSKVSTWLQTAAIAHVRYHFKLSDAVATFIVKEYCKERTA